MKKGEYKSEPWPNLISAHTWCIQLGWGNF